jgi:hypothetical protein
VSQSTIALLFARTPFPEEAWWRIMAKSEQPSAPSLGELLSPPAIAPNMTLGDGLAQCIEHFSESRRSLGSSEDHSDEMKFLHYAEGLYGCLQCYLHPQVLTFKISEQDWEYLHQQIQPLIENEVDIDQAELLLAPVIIYFNGLLLAQRIAESIGSVTAHTRELQQALFTIPEAAEYLRVSKDTSYTRSKQHPHSPKRNRCLSSEKDRA